LFILEDAPLHKHSVSIKGHPTSFSLEDEFYSELKRIAKLKSMSMAGLITKLDHDRDIDQNLSSAIRVFVLSFIKSERVIDDQ